MMGKRLERVLDVEMMDGFGRVFFLPTMIGVIEDVAYLEGRNGGKIVVVVLCVFLDLFFVFEKRGTGGRR